MNESKIVGIMAKLNAVHNQLVEDVDYVRSRGFPNQRFDHQQGYRGSYGNGPTSYTQNSQFQHPLQNKRPIPKWHESSLTTCWHSASMESEYELVKIEESDDFAVAEAVSNDTNPWCRSTPSHIYETSGCDETESTRLDIDLQNRSTLIHIVAANSLIFLFGLDLPRFAHIRSKITDEDPLPSHNRVYSRVIRGEQNLDVARSKETTNSEAIGFSVKTPSAPQVAAVYAPKPRDRSCTHCHRQGHDVTECFLVHGFPEWYYEQKGGSRVSSDNREVVSRLENKPAQRGGRSSKGNGRGRGRVNSARAPLSSSNGSDQITQLISLLQAQRPKSTSERLSGNTCLTDVIIDSGASHHMTGDCSILVDVFDIIPSAVTKPDGKASCATKWGTLLLRPFSRTLIGAGEVREGVYYFTGVLAASAHKTSSDSTSSGALWHRRLGHPSTSVLLSLPECHQSSKDLGKIDSCDTCSRAKQTREVFPISINKTLECFDLVHCDVWGPCRTPSTTSAVYFLTLVDDYSRSIWTYLMTAKSEVPSLIRNICAMADRQFCKPVRSIRSDNGTEFMCHTSYFQEHGILHETSCVDTPQQNARVERKHRHILNVARTCLFQGNLPVKFWGESILTATHLINRTPSSVLKGKTPYEVLFGKQPSYDMLRTFGCLCYAHIRPRDKDKFASRSRKCIFIGYPHADYDWFSPVLNDRSIDHEGVDSRSIDPITPVSEPATPNTHDSIDPTSTSSDENNTPPEPVTPQAEQPHSPSSISSPHIVHNKGSVHSRHLNEDHDSSSPGLPELLGKGHRPKHPLVYLKDYVARTLFSSHFFSRSLRFKCLANGLCNEQNHFKDDVLIKEWCDAMQKEIEALEANHTWDVTDLPHGKKAISSKWVYKLKFNLDGTLERHKARLVVMGNHQKEGIDFKETFAPVAKMTTVRLLLAVAAAKDWDVFQRDVHNAFLHGDLEQELGFTQSYEDYSLFSLNRDGTVIHVLVYVDDFIIAGNNPKAIDHFKEQLHKCFHMKDRGKLKYFLGLEVSRGADGFCLSQQKYALDIINEAGLLGYKPSAVPMELHHKLGSISSPVFDNPAQYRRLVDRFIYLTITRPDLSYAVHILSQFMQTPLEAHWHAALRLVRYLKGSPDQGILPRSDSALSLTAYCDSDYNACPQTRCSLSAYVLYLGDSPISWKTKKQDTVSSSSAEAEYRAMAYTLKEIKWLKALMTTLGVDHTQPILLFCDSQATIHIAANPVFHERTKHIEKDCHQVRDAVTDKVISTPHISTTDLLTKALPRPTFERLLSTLGTCNYDLPTQNKRKRENPYKTETLSDTIIEANSTINFSGTDRAVARRCPELSPSRRSLLKGFIIWSSLLSGFLLFQTSFLPLNPKIITTTLLSNLLSGASSSLNLPAILVVYPLHLLSLKPSSASPCSPLDRSSTLAPALVKHPTMENPTSVDRTSSPAFDWLDPVPEASKSVAKNPKSDLLSMVMKRRSNRRLNLI
ncbi:Integrase catalytic core [Arabidopsis suecica]|uniref:Integrase catalytic core n=1 Tax=Arabidopsis suecica TaxID=45249 RepID=A0A8T2FZG4_ARASU|nr:Integrase catalytic core [Arabidopsis suecica]